MGNDRDRFEFSVSQWGCVASRLLHDGATGRVSAVFDNSFHVEMADGLACIGNGGLDASPLTLITTAPERTNWPASGLYVNAKVTISAMIMRVGERFSFLLADAAEWTPDPLPLAWGVESLTQGLAAFRASCSGRAPLEGLGGFVHRDTGPFNEQAVFRIAERPIKGLSDWLIASIRDPDRRIVKGLRWVRPLIGMGPGLTPSGDDVLGGMMIALHGLGESVLCRRLWRASRRCAIDAGNPVAFAHLAAASEGMGSAGIHHALNAIMDGRPEAIRRTLAGIETIGHTSGWDAMAGVVIAVDAWLRAQTVNRVGAHTGTT